MAFAVLTIGIGAAITPTVADRAPAPPACSQTQCSFKLTPQQLLEKTQNLIATGRTEEARPLIAALAQAPETRVESDYLTGVLAAKSGQIDEAITHFRSVLAGHPEHVSSRLALATALMRTHKDGAADYHFRLAGNDSGLAPEVRAFIRQSRTELSMRKTWSVTTRFGIAPDSNINGGSDARTIDINFAGTQLPVTLNETARRRSGLGQTAGVSASIRLLPRNRVSILAEATANGINYRGKNADDLITEAAIGPQVRLGGRQTLTMQAMAGHRWYGGKRLHLTLGGRAALTRRMGRSGQVSLGLEGASIRSAVSGIYSGWSMLASANYERAIGKAHIANMGLFARRESRKARFHGYREIGFNAGIGGELPHGLNAGLSVQMARARHDAPMMIFSMKRRHDTRFSFQAQVGLRNVRIAGFSPSVTITHARNASTLDLYANKRTRLAATVSRYF